MHIGRKFQLYFSASSIRVLKISCLFLGSLVPGQNVPLRGSSQSLNRTINFERVSHKSSSQTTLDSDSQHGSSQDINDRTKFDQVMEPLIHPFAWSITIISPSLINAVHKTTLDSDSQHGSSQDINDRTKFDQVSQPSFIYPFLITPPPPNTHTQPQFPLNPRIRLAAWIWVCRTSITDPSLTSYSLVKMGSGSG